MRRVLMPAQAGLAVGCANPYHPASYEGRVQQAMVYGHEVLTTMAVVTARCGLPQAAAVGHEQAWARAELRRLSVPAEAAATVEARGAGNADLYGCDADSLTLLATKLDGASAALQGLTTEGVERTAVRARHDRDRQGCQYEVQVAVAAVPDFAHRVSEGAWLTAECMRLEGWR